MLWLKGCSRCGGDLALTWGADGAEQEVACLQCGQRLTAEQFRQVLERTGN